MILKKKKTTQVDMGMLASHRRVKIASFFFSLMVVMGLTHNSIMRNVKSCPYKYLVNSYDFVNDILSLMTAQRELPTHT
jgi:hypothetical protein